MVANRFEMVNMDEDDIYEKSRNYEYDGIVFILSKERNFGLWSIALLKKEKRGDLSLLDGSFTSVFEAEKRCREFTGTLPKDLPDSVIFVDARNSLRKKTMTDRQQESSIRQAQEKAQKE